ncbi:hypothetical protein C0Q70_15530 [Pomacea canaliculata]|uniref:protein-tyrosine-phosphatase n=1 Tax=Pomacea canaliculata TaxID=400727 RepID=A0A2T7NV42_POMCA|nr:hypothetical protein C0Q70_15530 [Pomacea canaliculata]
MGTNPVIPNPTGDNSRDTSDVRDEDYCSSCPGGCDYSRKCAPVPNCKEENVALGKQAYSSSLYTSSGDGEKSGPPCLAVNGNTGTTFRPISDYPDSPNCVHTRPEYNTSWWVDLGTIYPVSRITIYNRDTNSDRIRGARIYVDNQPCYTFPYNNFPLKIEVTCNIPTRGRTVTLVKENSFLNFCEFQVWGRFGPTCDQLCRCKENATCDQYYGYCSNGCEDGFYGLSCNQTCHCKDNSACDFTTGRCPDGCQSGWMGLSCNTTCSAGTFGPNCQQTCGKCSLSTCNGTTGVCESGCAVGYTTAYCNKSRTVRLKTCVVAMPLYQPVTAGPMEWNAEDDVESARMATRVTSQLVSVRAVAKQDGSFPIAIQVRFNPVRLVIMMVVGGKVADQELTAKIALLRVVSATMGKRVTSVPVLVLLVKPTSLAHCAKMTGDFWDECMLVQARDEATVSTALAECPDGKFGKNCAQNCGNCSSSAPCRHDDGRCEGGCADGFEGDLCQAVIGLEPPSESTPKALIIGVVVGAVLLAVIVIAVVIVIAKRRKRQSRQDATEDHSVLHNNHIYANPDKQEETVLSFTPKTVEKFVLLSPKFVLFLFLFTSPAGKADYGQAKDKTPARKKVEKVQILREDASDNIYVNVALAKSASESSLDTLIDDDNNGLDRSMESLGDDVNLYGNDESVYATFQQLSGPQLDSVQRHLVDRLASGQLPVVFDELPKGLTDDHHTAKMKVNFKKNRFASVLPCMLLYMKGYHNEKTYIAAQGPRDNTVVDFWRMVWQEQVTQIIMLTKLIEAGKCISSQSPESSKAFVLTATGRAKGGAVPLPGVAGPRSAGSRLPSQLLAFRTCTDPPPPPRPSSGALQDQFIFLYKAALEAYTGRDTVIPLDRFDVTFPQPINARRDQPHIDREFRTLMLMRSLTAEVPRNVAKQRENLAKNRNPDCLPCDLDSPQSVFYLSFTADGHLVYLTAHLEGRNQFINAVFMPNFCKYWPDEERVIQTGPYTVQHVRTDSLGGHLASHWLQMTKEGETWSRDVRVLRYNDWAEEVPSDFSDLMLLVETLGAARTKTEKTQPVVIQCM